MSIRVLVIGLTTLLAAPALAAPPASADVSATLSAPSGLYVYDTGRYVVTVRNTGPKTANAVGLTIALPETHTSPTVHVLGTLGAFDGRCSKVGTTLQCTLGALRKGASTGVFFDIALPQSAEPIHIDYDATTTSADPNPSNNGATYTASLLNDVVTVSSGDGAFNEHCTGRDLISFYECELYPSSISSHEIVFGDFGTLSIPEAPDYTGTWSQPTSRRLTFSYFDGNGDIAATFDGYGVSESCFEGLTTFFPESEYISAYSVCLQ